MIADAQRFAGQRQNVADTFVGKPNPPARELVQQDAAAARVCAGDRPEAHAGLRIVEDGREMRRGGKSR